MGLEKYRITKNYFRQQFIVVHDDFALQKAKDKSATKELFAFKQLSYDAPGIFSFNFLCFCGKKCSGFSLLSASQTSYLSQISQIISVERNLSCGEISDFCKEFNNLWSFIEIYAVFVLNLCGEKSAWRKSVWRKNDKYEVCS